MIGWRNDMDLNEGVVTGSGELPAATGTCSVSVCGPAKIGRALPHNFQRSRLGDSPPRSRERYVVNLPARSARPGDTVEQSWLDRSASGPALPSRQNASDGRIRNRF